ncbi:UNVERIFIED_CONTAM: Retrovirus-related Pol polyprotein from transposon RE2 [Sesamum latifolium]|uniref:Retrovirus-related Pol polyprotein from transposon RE2 n=1 Tax=Sesamum latifolium TaxID=2727402 RepID=A0AAW2XF20_9LAMI
MDEVNVSAAEAHRSEEAATQYEKDVLFIHPSEHSSLALTTSPLDGTNFLAWQRAVYVSLGTKMKLGFIDGSFPRPTIGSPNFELWRRVDLMIISWLWNSMSKDIVESFMYCATSRELWLAIQARYGRRNGPMVMQFLMGLHDSFNNERSQILMLDPLPDMEKTFSMIYAVEEQRAVQNDLEVHSNHMAYQLALTENKRGTDRAVQQKRSFVDKRNLHCTHCHKKGHARESCFQLHGVPEWYKTLGDKKKKERSFAANVESKDAGEKTPSHNVADIVAEVLKAMNKDNVPSDPLTNFANYAQFDHKFAGNTITPSDIGANCWIVDSGASNHVYGNINLFHSYTKSTNHHFIHLPDGSKKLVQYVGTMNLTHNITLENVLFVPQFSVNLLSDQDSKDSLVMGVLFKRLYIHKQDYSVSAESAISSLVSSHSVSSSASIDCKFSASLPIQFWDDAILTATYLINRTPTKVLGWKTPYEKLYGKIPHYNHLRTFGSLCYATDISPHKSKFQNRALRCVLTGYAMHKKAYKLFDLDNHHVIFSRDVQFYEGTFPFSTISQNDTSLPMPNVQLQLDHMMETVSPPDSPPATLTELTPSSHTAPVVAPIVPDSVHVDNLPLRRSHRQIHRPGWLNDFVSSVSSPSLLHSNSADYTSFVASLSTLQEPNTYLEAVKHIQWRDAMKEELDALERNCTWSLVPLPLGKHPIGCKWVFKTKLRADGSIERHKARFVAKGFHQVAGIDYNGNFSPVAKTMTVRLFLTLAAAHGWPLQQIDVNNAFLHGYLDEDLYMTPPEGMPLPLACLPTITVCLLRLHWFSGLTRNIGEARYFLGLEIARGSDGLYVAQNKYVQDIIQDTCLRHAKSTSTPFPLGLKLSEDCGAILADPERYRRLIGRLLYLGFTRPDISQAVQQLSQFLTRPCEEHWRTAVHVVRYLRGTPTKGLFFPSTSNFMLRAYCDADWASCTDSRRSLTGFYTFLGDVLMSWKTKKQTTVSRSTAEAEYRSMAATVCELKWISYILSDLGVPVQLPIQLFCDNQAALHIMANPVFHEQTKHIELDCHVVRDAYKDGFINPSFIRSSLQLADLFTKALSFKVFAALLDSWVWL